MDRYSVVSPVTPVLPAERRALAPRRRHLDGARIALVWDYLFFGDTIFDVVRDEITRRFDGVGFVEPDVFGNIHGHDEDEVIERLPVLLAKYGVDSVIAAVGA